MVREGFGKAPSGCHLEMKGSETGGWEAWEEAEAQAQAEADVQVSRSGWWQGMRKVVEASRLSGLWGMNRCGERGQELGCGCHTGVTRWSVTSRWI